MMDDERAAAMVGRRGVGKTVLIGHYNSDAFITQVTCLPHDMIQTSCNAKD